MKMTEELLNSGQLVYDPRGVVEAEARPLSARATDLAGLRLGVLDNTKWNAGDLLRKIIKKLEADGRIGTITYYRKESFSLNATPELIQEIGANNDVVLTAIGD